MRKFIAYFQREGDSARATVYDPAWDGIENHIADGVFYDGSVPIAEQREGYNSVLMVALEGKNTPQLYYTYDPVPSQPPSEIDELKQRIADVETVLTEIMFG